MIKKHHRQTGVSLKKGHSLVIMRKLKQDGRLAQAYFSQEYKSFDQHLLTVKKETTV